jgi:membrane-associated HD superfamily phosphohydrolase
MTDVEELIQEIALKHGITVSRDDPILILQTINKRLMEDSARAQQEMLDHYKEEIEALAKRWGDDTKTKAEKVLNAALTASRETMAKTAQEVGITVKQIIQQEVDAGLKKIRESIGHAHRLVILNVIAAGITLTAAFVALWAVR